MPRYIDADALRQRMYHEAFETDTDMQRWDSGCWIRYKLFEDCIERMPTISPDEVRGVGKWIQLDCTDEIYGIVYKCAKCGCSEIGEPNYCPNCGARMGGVQDALS